MSWRNHPIAENISGLLTRARTRTLSRVSTAMFCAIILLWDGVAPLSAQENPLREGEAGYLQQLLPSLQKIQSESNGTSGARDFGADEQSSAQSAPTQSAGNEQFGNNSNAGLWRPGPVTQSPAPPALADQTEARLADSRPIAPWPESGGVSNSAPAPGVAKGSTKPTTAATTGMGASKSSSARSDGLGKLAAFKGVESLKLDSTIVKIGLNTLLVLAASIGLIVVVRRTLPRQAQAVKNPTGRLRIEQTLSLGGKAELKVVRCGLHQVLVAIDSGGIKSVVALEPSLEPERENLEPAVESQPPAPLKEPVNIEQFVKMIRDMEGDLMSARPGR